MKVIIICKRVFCSVLMHHNHIHCIGRWQHTPTYSKKQNKQQAVDKLQKEIVKPQPGRSCPFQPTHKPGNLFPRSLPRSQSLSVQIACLPATPLPRLPTRLAETRLQPGNYPPTTSQTPLIPLSYPPTHPPSITLHVSTSLCQPGRFPAVRSRLQKGRNGAKKLTFAIQSLSLPPPSHSP